jgi:hypothetical protein
VIEATLCGALSENVLKQEFIKLVYTQIKQNTELSLQLAVGVRSRKGSLCNDRNGISHDADLFACGFTKLKDDLNSVANLLYDLDSVVIKRSGLYINNTISKPVKAYGDNRKLRIRTGDTLEFKNFYCPNNDQFYAKWPYYYLDSDENKICLFKVIVNQSHNRLEFDLINNVPLNEVKSNY